MNKEKGKKYCGKRRNCSLQAILPFPSVFKMFVLQTCNKQALVFTCLQHKSSVNTVGKGEIAHNKQFLLFPVFSTCLENFLPFSSSSKLSSAKSFSLE